MNCGVQDTHGLCVIKADLVNVWRMKGEHLKYNEAEGENVRLYCHLLVLYHLEIRAISVNLANFSTFFPVLWIRIRIRIQFWVLDPDQWGLWIRIQIQEGKNDPQK
jgi:hypothetical protein